ncbi:MAG: hypothetical protein B0D92_03200 [Spirochaeta sp. LUC14_002_19_P3]|nr:MAG: hypothetical protein B0D92_03200 [Spirochaeta sp. LUC14_002_19_P3]
MLSNGFFIMVVGMLVVFTFLTLMVISMRIMSSIILRFFPEPEETAQAGASGNEPAIAAAIAAAYFRKRV